MKVYEQIKEMLCDELEEIAKKKELTSSNLEVIDKAVDVIKDIDTITAMQEAGYSNDGYSGYPYMWEGSYEGGGSYARGRGRGANRDSRGRYSSDYSRDSYDGYSRNEGYSREGYSRGYSGDTREELQMMMDRAKNDREREAIRKALDSMK